MKNVLFIALTLFALTLPTAAERPNVIVIMSDDQGGGDYGFMGNDIIRTPELDVMAKRSGMLTPRTSGNGITSRAIRTSPK